MKKKFMDFVKLVLPMGGTKKGNYVSVSNYLKGYDIKDFRNYYKMGWVDVEEETFGSLKLGSEREFLLVKTDREDPELENLVDKWNKTIWKGIYDRMYKSFASKAEDKIVQMIAPNIVGMDEIKEACVLQLFAQEKVHILLLGDPGTGKTDIVRSVADLAPKSSYGLGSGTSGAGLSVTVQGNKVVEGLLPMAHEGLCCIDELNLLKEKDRAGLLNAMEKGFVSYDKGNKHIKVDADVKVLATANPKGDQFVGWVVETLKKQLPFDPALLTRFHLIFLIRKPDVEGFKEIARKIVSGKQMKFEEKDINFVKGYINYVSDLKIKFPKRLESHVTKFVEEIKENEDKYLVDVSPRLVVGLVRLSKASARLGMRTEAEEKDVKKVLNLMRKSLEIKKIDRSSDKDEKNKK